MATSGTNNLEKNFTVKLAKGVLDAFESHRIISKNVNTQKLDGKFNPDSGTTTLFKRPMDFTSTRTSGGDISSGTRNDIVRGTAFGEVQDYITTDVDFDEVDEALKMGNDEDEIYDRMAQRLVTDLEVDFASYMMKNTGLSSGTTGTAISTWDHVAEMGSVLQSIGVPDRGMWCAAVNPYTQTSLASNQRSLNASDSLVASANDSATIAKNFAGLNVLAATTLATYTTGTGADRSGTLTATPTATYVALKDTMQITLAVTAFQANLVVAAGETLSAVLGVTDRLNLSTRSPVINGSGAAIVWSGTVVSSVTLGASGEGSIVVSGPPIFESGGQYNTVSAALASGAVVVLGGAATTTYQPNLFWHKNAFSIGSVPIKKLFSTDTIATTKDGLQLRVSKYADGDANKNIVRVDLHPAYATLDPFFAGQGWGRA